MPRERVLAPCLLGLILAGIACGSWPAAASPGPTADLQAPLPRGDRLLSIDVNQASDGDYDSAFQLALQAGAQAVSLSLPWDALETAPGQYGPDPDYLTIANAYYPASDTPLVLTLAPIDTNQLRLPADLSHLAFDDPRLIDRFNRMLADSFSRLPETQLIVLAIGNEIDAYLGGDPGMCAAYEEFFAATSSYARSLRPGLQVGTKATSGGLLGSSRRCLEAINRHSDAILATYYPLKGDFSVRPPSSAYQDFAALASLASGKPVYLLEVGYPSSRILGSSDALQAEFVREVFRAWDAQAGQIRLVNFTWLHDISDEALAGFLDYYGLDSRRFAEFLGSLGLRSHDGRPKLAFLALEQEGAARGW